ncbi:hypothetical protein THRCLA_21920, partial [Thraustotheca clavata]
MVLLLWNGDALVKSQEPTLGINYIQASQSSVRLVDSSNFSLEIDQNIKLGIGGVVWNCGRALVEFISLHQEFICNKKVLELGCGSGVVGLFCGLYHPLSLMLTDLAEMLPLVLQNTQKAALQCNELMNLTTRQQLIVQELKWGDTKIPSNIDCDTILCSDCLYNPEAFEDFKNTIKSLASVSTTVLIAYKERHSNREKKFFKQLEEIFIIQVYSQDGTTPWNYKNDSVFIL